MPDPRKTLQRGVIILPSAFTLGNLFFGIYAMVSVSRGDFQWAGWCITIAGILDLLDGRVARLTRTGSAFGAQLDSLVDSISFGVAPGYVMFALFFADAEWSWVLAFVYITAVVVRLARFNMEQGGEAKRQYHGLPSTAAGMTLGSFFPFSQTLFFNSYLSDLPWQQIVQFLRKSRDLCCFSKLWRILLSRTSARFAVFQGSSRNLAKSGELANLAKFSEHCEIE